jgi:DNA processing protein
MNKDLEYWVATSAIPGVGTATFNFLLRRFKTLKYFWDSPDEEIRKLKIDVRAREGIIDFRKKVDPKVYLAAVYEKGIKVLSLADRDYPANLRSISDAPPVIYFRGTLLASDDLAIAVVGARHATVYGRQVTEKLVSSLVMNRLVIVSGLARGIDSIAHRAALAAGGRTIAVLGSGVDTIYPPENRELAEKITQNGALVSEFPLGFPSVPSNFPARNRIISGLSLGVLVTEAAIDSGSMITAGQAAEQGREVFAVPGPIIGKMSEGTNNLIKEGVHPATEAEDILGILNIERKQQRLHAQDSPLHRPDDKVQARILEMLGGQAKHVDIIAREVDMPIEKVSSALSLMELSGFVKNYGAGMWGE